MTHMTHNRKVLSISFAAAAALALAAAPNKASAVGSEINTDQMLLFTGPLLFEYGIHGQQMSVSWELTDVRYDPLIWGNPFIDLPPPWFFDSFKPEAHSKFPKYDRTPDFDWGGIRLSPEYEYLAPQYNERPVEQGMRPPGPVFDAVAASGLSAGGVPAGTVPPAWKDKLSVWANGARSVFANDYAGGAFGGNTSTATFGADWRYSNRVIFGASLGYENTDIGFEVGNNEMHNDGITVTPYLTYIFGEYFDTTWSANAVFGYANIDVDTQAGAIQIRGSTETERYFGNLTVNGSYWLDRWNLSGKVGYLRAHTDTDAFTNSANVRIASSSAPFGQVSVGGKVAYYFHQWMPFMNATFHYDHLRKRAGNTVAGVPRPTDDRTDVVVGGGATFFITRRFTGGATVNHTLNREQNSNTTVSGNLRYAF